MSETTKHGKIYTFWTLIKEHPIVVPKVQRDYAYGREDEKAKEVRTELLEKMKEAIVCHSNDDSSKMTMDFVYGSLVKGVGMEPLDGQQRLTTLFLLHVYAAHREGKFPDELSGFTYATRTSANEFCRKLVKGDFYNLVDGVRTFDNEQKIVEQIKNSNAYLPTYDEDPTIAAMLVVLADIEALFGDVEGLWTELTDTDKIRFYYLPLEEFGLSDDLYIKMNSRGKPLTAYELFKSKFEGYIEAKSKKTDDEVLSAKWLSLKNDISHKLDGVWTDMMWHCADNNVENVDNGFLNFFNAIIQILYCLNNDECSITEKYRYEDTICDVEDLEFVISFFDAFETKYRANAFEAYWDSFFYNSDEALGRNDCIRLFGRAKENIFITAIRGKLTNADHVLLYAVYLGLHHNISHDDLFNRLRVLRNLLTNSEFELRGKKIGAMLKGTKDLLLSGTIPTEGFNANQMGEEVLKNIDKALLVYENHEILRGTLLLFMNNGAVDLLPKFVEVFDNDYAKNTPAIRTELLKHGDYSQYAAWMDREDMHRRYFVHKPQVWRDFFSFNQNRRNQETIVSCLRAFSLDAMKNGDINSQYDVNNWQYYFIKYADNCYNGWSQGVYNWDDYEDCPLVINMLNSSSHNNNSENSGYLEWNLLNYIVYCRNQKLIDSTPADHGSQPISIKSANLSITAVQSGWKINVFDGSPIMIERLKDDGFNIQEGIYIVKDTDFVIEAEKLISQIVKYL
jgi:hypothetical protein